MGVLAYLTIEYTRLPVMYPVLEPLQLGKVAAALAVAGLLFSANGGVRSAARSVDYALLSFIVASFFATCFAENSEPAWAQLMDTLQWGVIYFLISRIVVNRWRFEVFLLLYCLLNLKLAQFAVREYLSGQAMGRSASFMAAHGVGAGSTGFFGNAGDFGVAMCVAWPLTAAAFAGGRSRTRKYVAAATFLAVLAAIIVCGSRGAVLGAVAVAALNLLKQPKRVAGAMVALAAAIAVIYFLPGASKDRFASALHPHSDETATIRLNLWTAGLKMYSEHPVLGVGPGNFPSQYLIYHPESDRKATEWVPHSIYIQALSELGTVGGLALLLMLVSCFRMNAATRKALRLIGEERSSEYYLAVGLDLALVGYMVSAAFITVLYYPHLWILLGLSTGLNASASRPAKPVAVTQPAPARGVDFWQRFGGRTAC